MHRGLVEAERLAQLGEDLHEALVGVEALGTLVLIDLVLPYVALAQLQQALLVPALGNGDGDAWACLPAWVEGQDQLPSTRAEALAQLGDGTGEELLTRLALQLAVVLEGVDLGDHTLSDVHEVDADRAVLVLDAAEDVHVVYVVRRHGVLDLIVLEVLQALLVDLCLLEAQG